MALSRRGFLQALALVPVAAVLPAVASQIDAMADTALADDAAGLTLPFGLTLEQDEDGSYLVSDDLVYGHGMTVNDAIQDYLLSFDEFMELCERETFNRTAAATTVSFERTAWGDDHVFVVDDAEFYGPLPEVVPYDGRYDAWPEDAWA